MHHEDFMRIALQEAALARDSGNWAIGCVIMLDGEIVVRGHNLVHSEKNRLLHAEMNTLNSLQAGHYERAKVKDMILYTTFEPCPMCFGAILMCGIRTVVSGVNFDRSGATAYLDHLPPFFRRDNFKTTLITGVLPRACAEMWLSGRPAKYLISQPDYTLPMTLEEVDQLETKTYITPGIGLVD